MSWTLLVAQLALSAVLLLSATGKALRPEDFLAALRLSHLPSRLVRSLSVTIPVLELGLALALVLSTAGTLPIALGATIVLLGVFTVWMTWVRANHLRVRCGCFGLGGEEVGWRTIARNGFLILLAGVGVVLTGRTHSPLPPPSFWMVVTVTSVSMCLPLLVVLREAAPDFVLTLERLREEQAAGRWLRES
jgi:hypothetical protein